MQAGGFGTAPLCCLTRLAFWRVKPMKGLTASVLKTDERFVAALGVRLPHPPLREGWAPPPILRHSSCSVRGVTKGGRSTHEFQQHGFCRATSRSRDCRCGRCVCHRHSLRTSGLSADPDGGRQSIGRVQSRLCWRSGSRSGSPSQSSSLHHGEPHRSPSRLRRCSRPLAEPSSAPSRPTSEGPSNATRIARVRTIVMNRGYSSVGRALVWHTRGQGFESP